MKSLLSAGRNALMKAEVKEIGNLRGALGRIARQLI
jgi:hypothetical protein